MRWVPDSARIAPLARLAAVRTGLRDRWAAEAPPSLDRGEEASQQRFPAGAADIRLGVPQDVDERGPAVLSSAERNRVRLLRDRAAASCAAAHVGLRRILGGYLGVEAGEVRPGRTFCPERAAPAHGPPAVVRPATRLTFNLSRADGFWLLGVSEDRPLGVDLEAEPRIDPELTAPTVTAVASPNTHDWS